MQMKLPVYHWGHCLHDALEEVSLWDVLVLILPKVTG